MAKKAKKVSSSRKNSTAAKQHPKHFLKVYWPYIPIIAVVVYSMLFGSVHPAARSNNPATLAYATEMGASALLSSTNAQRASNGLPPLTLNTKLNASAQAKANDMVSRDYWAHNSPDGKEPWVFIDAAGYSYQKAGENLAYGFLTSEATVIGWMNSPSHRANILDSSYSEVGFGFVNAENFISTGNETIVVAHYGLPLSSTVTPPPTSTNPTPVAAATTPTKTKQESVDTTTSPVAETTEIEPKSEGPVANENTPITTETPVPNTEESTNITRLQGITGGKAPWSALAISIISFIAVTIWLIKHAVLVKRYALQGEHFVAHHPIFDIIVVAIVAVAVYFSQFSGVVL
jgi:uncharacterized protein YkwD